MIDENLVKYIISFLVGEKYSHNIYYGELDSLNNDVKIVINPSTFWTEYGTFTSIPKRPFEFLPSTNIPFLFGESKIEYNKDFIVLSADLIASSFFLLSRYEEIVKRDSRDLYGRFLAKDSVVFQEGFGLRPLVDEWGRYLRDLLRSCGVKIPLETRGFSKIWLTHDIDMPFYYYNFIDVIKQFVKNIIRRGEKVQKPLHVFITGENDPYNTFSKINSFDSKIIENYSRNVAQDIYFIISERKRRKNKYYNINSRRYRKIIDFLSGNGSVLGLHVAHEGSVNPQRIKKEVEWLPKEVDKVNLYSRHHFLRWREPEDIVEMEKYGIRHDFSIGYPDCPGFRCGTSKSYYYINPVNFEVSKILIHPLQIMEATLDNYMKLSIDEAYSICTKVIDAVYENFGELDLLFHNSSFIKTRYHERLYSSLLEYIDKKNYK